MSGRHVEPETMPSRGVVTGLDRGGEVACMEAARIPPSALIGACLCSFIHWYADFGTTHGRSTISTFITRSTIRRVTFFEIYLLELHMEVPDSNIYTLPIMR